MVPQRQSKAEAREYVDEVRYRRGGMGAWHCLVFRPAYSAARAAIAGPAERQHRGRLLRSERLGSASALRKAETPTGAGGARAVSGAGAVAKDAQTADEGMSVLGDADTRGVL